LLTELKGFSFSSPPAHESPVSVGWWGFSSACLMTRFGGMLAQAGE
jgi:hypothetical protein